VKRVLVAYATFAGSTAEVAQAMGEELTRAGLAADVRPIRDVSGLDEYDAVVVGAPMIVGWHRSALGFLRKHRRDLRRMPLAVFVMAMSLTRTGDPAVGGVPVEIDDHLPKPAQREGRLTLKERYARVTNYVRPILAATGPRTPVAIGIFGGKLEYGRLPPWAVIFAMVILHATPGDRRDWAAIRSWAARLPSRFQFA
jgi:menaquinone-dependent protoporphyrinogen oxidase